MRCTTPSGGKFLPLAADGTPDYNMTIPVMLAQYFPTGLLGIGFTALMASFMSGMAGNVTAFNTVWTYDIYQSYIAPGQVGHALPLDGTHGPRWSASSSASPRPRSSPGSSITSWTCSSWCSGS